MPKDEDQWVLTLRSFKFSAERISTLRDVINWRRSIEGKGNSRNSLRAAFSQFDLYTKMFSARAWELSDRDKHLADLELVLDSLVSSGELIRDKEGYRIEGKALQTLSDFETEDRRARASDRSNTQMIRLTFVIAFAAAAQALAPFLPYVLSLLKSLFSNR